MYFYKICIQISIFTLIIIVLIIIIMSWKELNKEMEKIENIVKSLEDNPTRDDIEEDDKLSEGKMQ